MPAWRVLRPSGVASRFEALRGSALTPLVGRDEEIELLLRRWARAKAGDGQVVLISGEPGIGKSRIAAGVGGALSRRAAYPPALFLLALSPGQRALSVHRPARTGGRVRAATIRPLRSCRSSKPCWLAARLPPRMWRSSPICCRCRASQRAPVARI